MLNYRKKGEIIMAGHSEWANKKHRKEKSDAIRSKIFTKLGREIAVAVKLGGADPEQNPKLAGIILKAKANNMPNDNIARSIKNAAGLDDKTQYEEVTYECYGPHGTAFIVNCLTDNKNRTAGEVRHAFDKSGGSMGTNGCVSFMFDRKGVIVVDNKENKSEDDFMMDALEQPVLDIINNETEFVAYTEPSNLELARKGLADAGYTITKAQIEMVPQNYVELDDEKLESFEKLLERLDDCDDVQEYFYNVDY